MATLQSFLMMTVMGLRGQGTAIFTWVKQHFSDMVLFGVVFSFIVSFGVYAFSFVGNKMLALGGNTGNPIYDVSFFFFFVFFIQKEGCQVDNYNKVYDWKRIESTYWQV
jgi:hypothetical protein